ncbi:histidine kinase [Luedemannella flava]
MGTRSPEEGFTRAELAALSDLARNAGAAAHALRLNLDLQHARERLVIGREEERRRLRRDLHDGVGPTLAGMAMQLGVARTLLRTGEVARTGSCSPPSRASWWSARPRCAGWCTACARPRWTNAASSPRSRRRPRGSPARRRRAPRCAST